MYVGIYIRPYCLSIHIILCFFLRYVGVYAQNNILYSCSDSLVSCTPIPSRFPLASSATLTLASLASSTLLGTQCRHYFMLSFMLNVDAKLLIFICESIFMTDLYPHILNPSFSSHFQNITPRIGLFSRQLNIRI